MPSSWDVYYVVFLSALLALGIPAFLSAVSHLVSAEKRKTAAPQKPQLQVPTADLLRKKINARFFLGVNAALILMTLGLTLIPCTGMLQQATDRQSYLRCLIAIISIAGFCGLGLLYSSRKGDLSWIQSFQKQKGAGDNPAKE